MTEQQKTAIESPCRLACETANPKFRMIRLDSISVIVTVNSGYE